MKKLPKTIALNIFLIFLAMLASGCSSDDMDCPETMVVDIDDPESLARAEACGLSPANPLSNLWVSDNQK